MRHTIIALMLLTTPALAEEPSHAVQVALDATYILEGMTHTPAGQRHVAEMFARPDVDTGSVLRAANFAPF